jgi:hypothetical protein
MRFLVEQYDGVPTLLKTDNWVRGNRFKPCWHRRMHGIEATTETIVIKDRTGKTRRTLKVA